MVADPETRPCHTGRRRQRSVSGIEGVMTRARRRSCGLALADLPLSPRSESVRPRKRPPRAKERRDWANLTADLVRDVADRLLIPDSPWPAAHYNRLRAVCKTWRESTEDPRSFCSLDIRFRPRGWTPIRDRPSASGCRLSHVSGVRTHVELHALTTNHVVGVIDGLLVLRDKQSTDIVRLLNPLTGGLTEFPPITLVRAYDGSELKSSRVIDDLRLYFSDPTEFRAFVSIVDSTSPPTLLFFVKKNNGPCPLQLHAVYAKPGDQHWVSVHNMAGSTLISHMGRLACYLSPQPGVCMAEIIYLYSLSFRKEDL